MGLIYGLMDLFWIVSKEENVLIEWRLKESEFAMECILKHLKENDKVESGDGDQVAVGNFQNIFWV